MQGDRILEDALQIEMGFLHTGVVASEAILADGRSERRGQRRLVVLREDQVLPEEEQSDTSHESQPITVVSHAVHWLGAPYHRCARIADGKPWLKRKPLRGLDRRGW